MEPASKQPMMTDRTFIFIGIMVGVVMIVFITAVASNVDPVYSPWAILGIDLFMVAMSIASTELGVSRRRQRRVDQQEGKA